MRVGYNERPSRTVAGGEKKVNVPREKSLTEAMRSPEGKSMACGKTK